MKHYSRRWVVDGVLRYFRNRYVEVFYEAFSYVSAIYRGVRGSLLCSGALDPEALVSRRSFSLGLPPGRAKLWKRLHVRKWQAKDPPIWAAYSLKIMPEKKLTKENYENLPRMIEETCVAEWTHILLSIAGLGLLKIWSGVGGVCDNDYLYCAG